MISSALTVKSDEFARILPELDQMTDLARPALMLAADEYPEILIEPYLAMLDDLADEALQTAVSSAITDCDATRRLARFLAENRRFRGNGDSYNDPRNSYLNEVLDRRAGIPISLSLVLIEVGRRLGLPLVGIGFPGHFLVGCGPIGSREYLLIDPFCDGKVVDWQECTHRLQVLGMEFDPEAHLSPVTNRQFFTRMLTNLKSIYMARRDVDRVLRVISRLVMLDPTNAEEYRQFGALLASEGASESARRCLRAYLSVTGEGTDADAARRLLSHLLAQRAQWN